MGNMHGESFRDQLGKEKGLEMHLRTQFYPPHPEHVVKSTTEGFKKYWDGEIDEIELATKYCYLRSVDGLYRYYQMFLDDEGPYDDDFQEDIIDGEYEEV
jgi:hypothetical protein